MASTDYIPATDAGLDNWATNFSTLLTASPATYGLVAGDGTIVAGVFTTWHTAYLAAISPATRTPSQVQTKNDAKFNMLAVVRPYAQEISQNAGVLTDDKIAIGVNPRTNTPTPIAAPGTQPVLAFLAATNLAHQMTYRDETQPETVKAKPPGVKFCEVHAAVSTSAVIDQNLIPFKGMYSKSPFTVTFGAEDVGKQAYYCSRWINDNGLVGPWSGIVSLTVAN